MAQRFSSKDVLGTMKGARTSGIGTAAAVTRKERKILMKNPVFRRALTNPSATFSAAQVRGAVGAVQSQKTETGEKQETFSRFKSAGTETRKMQKAVLERSVQEQNHEVPERERRYNAGPSEEQKEMKKTAWEKRLEKAREKGERRIEKLETEGRVVAVRRREVAQRGIAVARSEQIEVIKEQQKAERKKELTTLADKNPKELSGHAVDLAI